MERKMCGCATRLKSKEDHNAELRKDAARIVAGVENYSGADKMKRAAEVKAAFPPVKAKKPAATAKTAGKSAAKTTTKAAAKPAAKKTTARATGKTVAKAAHKRGPAPAGMSAGRHDGDVC